MGLGRGSHRIIRRISIRCARDHADAGLVNMLLSELCPLDVRQLFICHKTAFYAVYATWPEEKCTYVVDFLDRE
jgi:hypothetical protein